MRTRKRNRHGCVQSWIAFVAPSSYPRVRDVGRRSIPASMSGRPEPTGTRKQITYTTTAAMMADDLVERVLRGEARAIGRAISLAENEAPGHEELLGALYRQTGHAYRAGRDRAAGRREELAGRCAGAPAARRRV